MFFRISQIPESLLERSYKDLANHITTSCQNDLDRVRAVFNGMISLKRKNIATVDDEKSSDTPLHDLQCIHSNTYNDAHFFFRLSK